MIVASGRRQRHPRRDVQALGGGGRELDQAVADRPVEHGPGRADRQPDPLRAVGEAIEQPEALVGQLEIDAVQPRLARQVRWHDRADERIVGPGRQQHDAVPRPHLERGPLLVADLPGLDQLLVDVRDLDDDGGHRHHPEAEQQRSGAPPGRRPPGLDRVAGADHRQRRQRAHGAQPVRRTERPVQVEADEVRGAPPEEVAGDHGAGRAQQQPAPGVAPAHHEGHGDQPEGDHARRRSRAA